MVPATRQKSLQRSFIRTVNRVKTKNGNNKLIKQIKLGKYTVWVITKERVDDDLSFLSVHKFNNNPYTFFSKIQPSALPNFFPVFEWKPLCVWQHTPTRLGLFAYIASIIQMNHLQSICQRIILWVGYLSQLKSSYSCVKFKLCLGRWG